MSRELHTGALMLMAMLLSREWVPSFTVSRGGRPEHFSGDLVSWRHCYEEAPW